MKQLQPAKVLALYSYKILQHNFRAARLNLNATTHAMRFSYKSKLYKLL
jgi:hypothetical protein